MEQEVSKWELRGKIYSLKAAKMMIAICNLNKEFVLDLKNKIYRYCAARNIDAVVDCFSSGEKLLERGICYSLVFLDYELEGKNGLVIAEALGKIYVTTRVVFYSSNLEMVFKAFEINAFRFLVPPVSELKLQETLNSFFEAFNAVTALIIKSREEQVRVNVAEILFVEANNKHCIIHITEESFECNRTMARVYELIGASNFGKINRAYVVNFSHIKRFNSDCVTLCDGTTLHISRKYLPVFKDQYFKYLHPLVP